MKILLIGSGGREHAMAWKMAQSPLVEKIYALPGNDAMIFMEKLSLVKGDISDLSFILKTAKGLKTDLVVVGPEKPLAEGVVDVLEKAGIAVFGPSKEAAKLESSKVFSKKFMKQYGIPTARAEIYDNYLQAREALLKWDFTKGVVIKADELAGGKGVVVTKDREHALKTLYDFMENPKCSVHAESVLLEEVLTGKEVSSFAICDGENFVTLGHACDYKRVADGDLGPNTGGMGGYSLQTWPGQGPKEFIEEKIFKVVLAGMKDRGTPFKGILFAGLMIEDDKAKVIEFNVRLGDPEAQILLPMIEQDLVPLFQSAAKGDLSQEVKVICENKSSLHVVMASKGYPSIDGSEMSLGNQIQFPSGLLPGKNSLKKNQYLFFSGAKCIEGQFINSGGRVLGLTVVEDELSKAKTQAYETLGQISFQGAHWRRDIGS
jgi:phosphoribosylamine--glycine ligase